MIDPASFADWITSTVMACCLGACAALGYGWALAEPDLAVPEWTEDVTGRDDHPGLARRLMSGGGRTPGAPAAAAHSRG